MPTYVLEREFDAPRALVWKAWTDPALLPRWYGPRVETIVHRLELNPAIPASAVGGSVRRAGAGGVTEDLTARQPLPSHEVVCGVDHGHVVP